jgi:hypothetical protein
MFDEDINKCNPHMATKLKMASLFDSMIDSFKNKGHYVVMDSAYMSDAMCLVGRNVWLFNFVGTCVADRYSPLLHEYMTLLIYFLAHHIIYPSIMVYYPVI